jgi:L-ribulokinase
MDIYTIGIDFGTDSVRALVVNTSNGENIATAVSYYQRWKEQLYCDPSQSRFRQHPLDYIESIHHVLQDVCQGVGEDIRKKIVGISVDTTGSTPVAVDKSGLPLSLHPEFAENPNAMFILWKDHTANKEAEEINQLATKWEVDFTKYVGGIYSSEWFWAKILHILRIDKEVRKAAYSWVEHCDWISGYLAGIADLAQLKRSRCAAGHKGMWHEEFDGLPHENFLSELDPLLSGLRARLYEDCYTSDQVVGTISKELAKEFGLSEDVVIGVGAFDCHMGAIGAKIKPFDFVRVMGTSTCDMLIAPKEDVGSILVKGICGQVDGSITAGMIGMEAGQSAYGDYYAWWQKVITQPIREILGEEAAQVMMDQLLPHLAREATKRPVTENDIIATDWINGRRTPDANHELKAAFLGMDLGTDAVAIFKMIVEATAFGSKAIVDRFTREGIKINQVIAIGGVAKKSPFVMQTLSDVLNMTIKVASSDQACALGAAINAAVAAGVYTNTQDAQEIMGSDYDEVYHPRMEVVPVYEILYKKYIKLGKFVENYD